ncbi:MAG: universal stress protein [Caldilineaceae bacterium]
MTKNKVLILLDGSEFRHRILPHIRRFIRPEENSLILFRVGEPPQTVYPIDGMFYVDLQTLHDLYDDETKATITSQMRDELLETKEALEGAGYSVSREVRLGNVAQEALDYIYRHKIDLVAMTTRGRSGLSKALYGSVAEHILRHVTIPILLVRSPD